MLLVLWWLHDKMTTHLEGFLLQAFCPYQPQMNFYFAVCPWYGHRLPEPEANRKYIMKIFSSDTLKNWQEKEFHIENEYWQNNVGLCFSSIINVVSQILLLARYQIKVLLTWNIVWYGWSMAIFFTRETNAICIVHVHIK